jgi:hypothetical protein
MLASMAWTMWFLYGLDYAFAYAASMIHLWATIRGKSFPVTNSLSIVAHRCLMEVSISQHIESPHSPGQRSNHRAAWYGLCLGMTCPAHPQIPRCVVHPRSGATLTAIGERVYLFGGQVRQDACALTIPSSNWVVPGVSLCQSHARSLETRCTFPLQWNSENAAAQLRFQSLENTLNVYSCCPKP